MIRGGLWVMSLVYIKKALSEVDGGDTQRHQNVVTSSLMYYVSFISFLCESWIFLF